MKRLCSREEDLKKALIEQAWALLGRGHQEQWIIEGFSKALLRPREQTLEKVNKP
jgi:hypothetical protein